MKREHTPGPWRIGDAGNTVFGPKTDRPSPQTIATLSVIDHEANGHLIAAAPDLLAALKAAIVFIDGYQDNSPEVRAQADAAILRASGLGGK